MRDLTAEELAFRPHPGEHIEITQVRRDGGESRLLLRLPVNDNVALPLQPGTRLVARAGRVHLVTVVGIEPRERAAELVGMLAVARELDTSAFTARLAARGINAALRSDDGAIALVGSAPAGSAGDVTIPLAHPPGTRATIVAANVGRARWARFASPLVLLAALAAAAWLWRRGAARPPAAATERAIRRSVPPQPPPQRKTAETAETDETEETAPSSPSPDLPPPPRRPTTPPSPLPPRRPTPPSSLPLPAPRHVTPSVANGGAATAHAMSGAENASQPAPPRERRLSGHVDVSLARSGSVMLSASSAQAPSWPIDPTAAPDTRTEEYRALFAEFVKMRRTTGEPVEALNVNRFVDILRATRARIMKQIPVKDVRFKLAFQNGKAAIRYFTL
jgi:hypothetical protein